MGRSNITGVTVETQLSNLSTRIQEVMATFTQSDYHDSIVMVSGIMLPRSLVKDDLVSYDLYINICHIYIMMLYLALTVQK